MKRSVRVELPENFSAWIVGANEAAAEKTLLRLLERLKDDGLTYAPDAEL